MTNHRNTYNIFSALLVGAAVLFTMSSCRKLIDNNPSGAQLLDKEVFKDSNTVKAAVAGMYATLSNGNLNSTVVSTLPGFSADELTFVGNTYDEFINNAIRPDNPYIPTLWTSPYSLIYYANGIIEGTPSGINLTEKFKTETVAEARFMRAFCYCYLMSFFGDVPLVLNTNVDENKLSPRTAVATVYNQVVEDLRYAQSNLPADYSVSGGARVRANKWAATALLARVYLYTGKWADAESQSTSIINNKDLFELPTDLNRVFVSNSKEAIFQFYNSLNGYTAYAEDVLPNPVQQVPKYVLTEQLKAAFEPNDARKSSWTATINYLGTTYTYPAKYKSLAAGDAEYFTLFRLAEQYLIRAEARARLQNISGAREDLFAIRNRANLGETPANDPDALLLAVEQERRVELNCEMGHRWFDLKRTGRVNAVIGAIKAGWKPEAALYPIPAEQRIRNGNLTPNPGYN